MGKRIGTQQKKKKKYNAPCDIVITPNLKNNPKPPHTKEYNIPTTKIPFMLIMFLLCLGLFVQLGKHWGSFDIVSWVSSITNVHTACDYLANYQHYMKIKKLCVFKCFNPFSVCWGLTAIVLSKLTWANFQFLL